MKKTENDASESILGLRTPKDFDAHFSKFKTDVAALAALTSDSIAVGHTAKAVLQTVWAKVFLSKEFRQEIIKLEMDMFNVKIHETHGLIFRHIDENLPLLRADNLKFLKEMDDVLLNSLKIGVSTDHTTASIGIPEAQVNKMVAEIKYVASKKFISISPDFSVKAKNHISICNFVIKWYNKFVDEIWTLYPELKNGKQIKGFPKIAKLTPENYLDAFGASEAVLAEGKYFKLEELSIGFNPTMVSKDNGYTYMEDLNQLKTLAWKSLQGYFLLMNKENTSPYTQKAIEEGYYETKLYHERRFNMFVDDVYEANMILAVYYANLFAIEKVSTTSPSVGSPKLVQHSISKIITMNLNQTPLVNFKDKYTNASVSIVSNLDILDNIKSLSKFLKTLNHTNSPSNFLKELNSIIINSSKDKRIKEKLFLDSEISEFGKAYSRYIIEVSNMMTKIANGNKEYYGDQNLNNILNNIGLRVEGDLVSRSAGNRFNAVEITSKLTDFLVGFSKVWEKDTMSYVTKYLYTNTSLTNESLFNNDITRRAGTYLRDNIQHFIMIPSRQGLSIPKNEKNEYLNRLLNIETDPSFLTTTEAYYSDYANHKIALQSIHPFIADFGHYSEVPGIANGRDQISPLFKAILNDIGEDTILKETYTENSYDAGLAVRTAALIRLQVGWVFTHQPMEIATNMYNGIASDFPIMFVAPSDVNSTDYRAASYTADKLPRKRLVAGNFLWYDDGDAVEYSIQFEKNTEGLFTLENLCSKLEMQSHSLSYGSYGQLLINKTGAVPIFIGSRIPGTAHTNLGFGARASLAIYVREGSGYRCENSYLGAIVPTPKGDFFEGDKEYREYLYNAYLTVSDVSNLMKESPTSSAFKIMKITSIRSVFYNKAIIDSMTMGVYWQMSTSSLAHITDEDGHALYDLAIESNIHDDNRSSEILSWIEKYHDYDEKIAQKARETNIMALGFNRLTTSPSIVDFYAGTKLLQNEIDALEKSAAFAQPFSKAVKCFPTDGLFVIYETLRQKLNLDFSNQVANMSGDMGPSSDDKIDFLVIKDSKNNIHKVPEGNIPVDAKSLLPDRLHNFLGDEEHYIELLRTDEGISLHGVLPSFVVTLIERSIANFDELLQRNSILLNNSVLIDDFKNIEYINLSNINDDNYIMSDKVVKEFIPTISRIVKTEECIEAGVDLKSGILLEGPYGTGKTMTAFYLGKIAVENGWTFIYIRNSTEENILKTLECLGNYQKASKGLLVFVEDIDRIISDRKGNANKIVNVLDGGDTKFQKVIVVFTTNHLELIDPSILRGKRISKIINIPAVDDSFAYKFIKFIPDSLLDKPKSEMTLEEKKELMSPIIGFVSAFAMEIIDQAKAEAIYNDSKIQKSHLSTIATNYNNQVELAKTSYRKRDNVEDALKFIGQQMALPPKSN